MCSIPFRFFFLLLHLSTTKSNSFLPPFPRPFGRCAKKCISHVSIRNVPVPVLVKRCAAEKRTERSNETAPTHTCPTRNSDGQKDVLLVTEEEQLQFPLRPRPHPPNPHPQPRISQIVPPPTRTASPIRARYPRQFEKQDSHGVSRANTVAITYTDAYMKK